MSTEFVCLSTHFARLSTGITDENKKSPIKSDSFLRYEYGLFCFCSFVLKMSTAGAAVTAYRADPA